MSAGMPPWIARANRGGRRAARAPEAREDEVRVADARPVAREMLPARDHAGACEAGGERDREPGDPPGLDPEGPVADDAVARVRPDVEHRREVEVDTGGAE